MKCYNCNKKISPEDKVCPHCNTKIDMQRCPECWTKLSLDVNLCPKCGCDIQKHRKEEEEKANYKKPTLAEKIKALPLWQKIAVPSVVVVVICALLAINIYSDFAKTAKARQIAAEYIEYTDSAIEEISAIAQVYEKNVYGADWLNHIENAQKVREKHKKEIADLKKTREPVAYFKSRIAAAGDEEIATLAKDVHRYYSACYSHVIGENGKYPHYLADYNKLLKKYEKAVSKLKKAIE